MTVSSVLVLGCGLPAHPSDEAAVVVDGLRARGVRAETVPWDRPEAFPADRDLVVVRSTWDYTARPAAFLEVLAAQTVPVTNPVDVVRWNAHKSYLPAMGEAGVPVVPTTLLRAGVPALVTDHASWAPDRLVLKPAVAAGSDGVGLFRAEDPAAQAHLDRLLTTGDVLVQPFVAEVAEGERSLVWLGGTWSHAIRKVPTGGDFRVQEDFGGRYEAHVPTPAELAVGEAALAQVPGGAERLTYARVDLLGPAEQPMLAELELIEPDLYLRHAPGSLELFLDVLLSC